jgi:hypothetical protein
MAERRPRSKECDPRGVVPPPGFAHPMHADASVAKRVRHLERITA